MKIRTAIVAACVAALGLADFATAQSASARTTRSHAKRHHLAKAAIIHARKAKSGSGVTVSTGDVNGDGTSDVVTSGGGRKNKPAK